MANVVEDTENVLILVLIIGLIAIIGFGAASLLKLFGGNANPAGPDRPLAPKNPIVALQQGVQQGVDTVTHSFSGNPSDPGYGFFYGPDAYSWTAFKNWMSGKWAETVGSDTPSSDISGSDVSSYDTSGELSALNDLIGSGGGDPYASASFDPNNIRPW